MVMDATKLKALVECELLNVHDDRIVRSVQEFLVEPRAELRSWDYGAPNQKYVCWIAFDDREGTGIAYCEQGFGPRLPWGLISPEASNHESMGMDSGWFPTFMEAYFESSAATDLPIWQLFSMDGGAFKQPLTDELTWDEAWRRCEQARQSGPATHFGVHHSIVFGKIE